MAVTDNIKLRKQNFTVEDGYFYTFDDDQDALLQKTDDGNTAFSYPCDELLDSEVTSLEFDGVYFWSLQNTSGGPTENDLYIKKWKLDNYICKLQDEFIIESSGSHYYNADCFTIDHYHTSFSTTVSGGETTLYLSDYWDNADVIPPATSQILHLGPNENGEEEDVTVVTTISGGVDIAAPTLYDYSVDDEINFNRAIYIFNNNDGNDSTTGALYKHSTVNGGYMTRFSGGAYKAISACTFSTIDSFTEFGSIDMLLYTKGTNTLFVNIFDDGGSSLPYYGSMVMDNIEGDEYTIDPLSDMAIDRGNMYRLHDAGATYSYNLSPLESFVTSISVSASPAIIAANGLSTTAIVATVKDQFLQPIIGRRVTFSEDGDGTITGGTQINTDGEGQSSTVYQAGTSAASVKFTAVVEQTS